MKTALDHVLSTGILGILLALFPAPAAAWIPDGVPVCLAPDNQDTPEIAGDGAGGAIIAWDDARADAQLDIYSALVAADGTLVPTRLLGFDAWFAGDAVTVAWRIAGADPALAFTVWRRTAGAESGWERLAVPVVLEGDHHVFRDDGVRPGLEYRFRIALAGAGAGAPLFETAGIRVPGAAGGLLSNTPNPFNPLTTIRFASTRPGPVRVTVHDLAGRLVRTLLSGGELAAGPYALVWDGRDDGGRDLPSGAYVCRVASDGMIRSRRMMLVR